MVAELQHEELEDLDLVRDRLVRERDLLVALERLLRALEHELDVLLHQDLEEPLEAELDLLRPALLAPLLVLELLVREELERDRLVRPLPLQLLGERLLGFALLLFEKLPEDELDLLVQVLREQFVLAFEVLLLLLGEQLRAERLKQVEGVREHVRVDFRGLLLQAVRLVHQVLEVDEEHALVVRLVDEQPLQHLLDLLPSERISE